jgi:hypothetical protein
VQGACRRQRAGTGRPTRFVEGGVYPSSFLEFPLTFRNSLLSTAVLGKRKPLKRHLLAICVSERRQSTIELFRLPSERYASGLIPALCIPSRAVENGIKRGRVPLIEA